MSKQPETRKSIVNISKALFNIYNKEILNFLQTHTSVMWEPLVYDDTILIRCYSTEFGEGEGITAPDYHVALGDDNCLKLVDSDNKDIVVFSVKHFSEMKLKSFETPLRTDKERISALEMRVLFLESQVSILMGNQKWIIPTGYPPKPWDLGPQITYGPKATMIMSDIGQLPK